MKLVLLFSLYFLCHFVKNSSIPVKLINSYLENKVLKHVVILHCCSKTEFLPKVRELEHYYVQTHDVTSNDASNFQDILKVNYYRLGIFFDLDCDDYSPQMQQLLQDSSSFNESYFWLMHTEKPYLPTEFLSQLPLFINAEILLALCENDCDLYDVYNPSYRNGGKLNITLMGRYTSEKGVNIFYNDYKYVRRGNLHGLSLNVTTTVFTVQNPSIPVDVYTYLTKPHLMRHIDTPQRYNYAVILQLRDYYNFTINLTLSTTWGYFINGSFNGIVGDMIKGMVDISAAPMNFKSERLSIIDYTVVTITLKLAIIFRHPKKNVMQNNFLKPFTTSVWWATSVTTCLNWILLYGTIKIRRYYKKLKNSKIITDQPMTEVTFITTAAVSQQGHSDVPNILSFRITFLSLLLWAMMMYEFYSASIVGSLLAEPPRFIKTVYDLANSDLEFGAEDIAYMYDLFRTSTDPALHYLYEKKMAPNKYRKAKPYYSAEDGLRKVKRGGFAFHIELHRAYKIITEKFTDDEICDLEYIELVTPKPLTAATRKRSPFTKMVKYGLRQIVEHGTPQRLENVWFHQRPECPEGHTSKPTAITLTEFFPAIFLLICGCIFAAVIIVMEVSFYSYKHRSKELCK